jgi:hypothetical protein
VCALTACAVFLAAAALAPRTASADDWGDGADSVQTSSSTSSSTAQNDNTTLQTASPTQTGASSQSQSTIQVAPTEQTAGAASRSTQRASNVGSGGSANQQDRSSASSSSKNSNETRQTSAQQQESAPPPDPAPAPAQSQSSSQSAPTSQHADATATSNQVAPTNINISVRIDSPGNDGPVTQTNSSSANAVGNNANTVEQDGTQAQSGGRSSGEQSQSASQSAPTNQVSNATSTSNQVGPTNLNITIRNKSPGDDGPVTQTNDSSATADAANENGSSQHAGQDQESAPSPLGTPHSYIPRGHTSYPPAPTPQPAPAGATQSQTVVQSAPTSQAANAKATSTQQAPTNRDVSLTVDEDAADPNGSGRHGTLIQIWIPRDEAMQTNTSSAGATAGNANRTSQAAEQRQTAPSGGATQVGGASQTQSLVQGAPVTQNAWGGASSMQSAPLNVADGGSAVQTTLAVAQATVENANRTIQNAEQIQAGGGSQLQIIEQIAPVTQLAGAQAAALLITPTNVGTDGWSIQTSISASSAVAGKSSQTTQSAEQIQVGTTAGSAVQVIEQSAATTVRAHARQACKRSCTSSSRAVATLGQQLTFSSGSTGKDSSRSREPGASAKTKQRAPRDGQLPRAPELPGAAAGSSSGGGGGSLWVFAALLIPFALAGSWLARHYGPSAIRRLTGVVVRPERPG